MEQIQKIFPDSALEYKKYGGDDVSPLQKSFLHVLSRGSSLKYYIDWLALLSSEDFDELTCPEANIPAYHFRIARMKIKKPDFVIITKGTHLSIGLAFEVIEKRKTTYEVRKGLRENGGVESVLVPIKSCELLEFNDYTPEYFEELLRKTHLVKSPSLVKAAKFYI